MTSCMGQFVNQDSVEFTWTEQPIDADGKQDTGVKDSPNCGTRMAITKAHGNAFRYETWTCRRDRPDPPALLPRDALCVCARSIA